MNNQYPKISIITPSYNQGKFLEQTILSVINQDYPNIEYIIMDGGSTDNSVDIIKKYEDRLTYWVSEKDSGQADAVFRGLKRSTGDICAYINSDDYYLPGAFKAVAKEFMNDQSVNWVVGDGLFLESDKKIFKKKRYPKVTIKNMLYLENCVFQPSTFWKHDFFDAVGGFDRSLKYSFDYDLFMRYISLSPPKKINSDISVFRIHPQSKTSTINYVGIIEHKKIYQEFLDNNPIHLSEHIFYSFIGLVYKIIHL